MLSRYSFSILLIHWFILHLVVRQTIGITFVPLAVVCTLVLCLAYAVYYDNVFVVCLEWLCGLMFDLPGRVKKLAAHR